MVDVAASNFLALPDGSELGLHLSRFDELQRRLRLRLPAVATCWDYAALIDVIRREPAFDGHRFTGQTAAQWMCGSRARQEPDRDRFSRWYEATVNRHLASLARRPRVPDNHYCIELARPPLASSLPGLILDLGLKRANVAQWCATLHALTRKGLKPEELEASGVLTRLKRMPPGELPTDVEVARMVDPAHVTPKFASESRFGFVTTAGWYEGCQRIPEKEFRRRGLLGSGHGALHVIRYRHHSLGWSIVRTRYRDLLTERPDWWSVLDEKGRSVGRSEAGFESPEDAMAFAELQMSQQFAAWGRDNALPKWQHYSLPGGNSYREILIQLDDWPGTYEPAHYRTRNVLVHLRTSVRATQDGRRILFLDEVQCDWHAELHAESRRGATHRRKAPPPDAPFRKEWPLLSMKLMVWWAQRLGVDGLAWSTTEMQQERWRGFGPPESLYRSALPDAANSIAATLGLAVGLTELSVRMDSRSVDLGKQGWVVRNRDGTPITKPFRRRDQAELFADQTGEFEWVSVPVLRIDGMALIRSIPLYGNATAEAWWRPSGAVSEEEHSAEDRKRPGHHVRATH